MSDLEWKVKEMLDAIEARRQEGAKKFQDAIIAGVAAKEAAKKAELDAIEAAEKEKRQIHLDASRAQFKLVPDDESELVFKFNPLKDGIKIDEIPSLEDARNIMTGISSKPKDPKDPAEYYAIDCETIYVRKNSTDPEDPRKSPSIDSKLVKEYHEEQNPKGRRGDYSENEDEALSFLEILSDNYLIAKLNEILRSHQEPIITTIDEYYAKVSSETIFCNLFVESLTAYFKSIVQTVARVTIVDRNGKPVLDEYIYNDPETVYWTSYAYSGISQNYYKELSEQDLKDLHGKNEALNIKIKAYIDGPNIIIGHGLINSDFPAMKIVDYDPKRIRDTSIYYATEFNYQRMSIKRAKLKELIKFHLGIDIQQESSGHNPLEDARAALALYILDQKRDDRLFNDNKVEPKSLQAPFYNIELIRQIINFFEMKLREYKTGSKLPPVEYSTDVIERHIASWKTFESLTLDPFTSHDSSLNPRATPFTFPSRPDPAQTAKAAEAHFQDLEALGLVKKVTKKKKYLKYDENQDSHPKLNRDAKHLYLKYDQNSERNHDPKLNRDAKHLYLKYKNKYLKLKAQYKLNKLF